VAGSRPIIDWAMVFPLYLWPTILGNGAPKFVTQDKETMECT
jgi:hypothetical protein